MLDVNPILELTCNLDFGYLDGAAVAVGIACAGTGYKVGFLTLVRDVQNGDISFIF